MLPLHKSIAVHSRENCRRGPQRSPNTFDRLAVTFCAALALTAAALLAAPPDGKGDRLKASDGKHPDAGLEISGNVIDQKSAM
jgi:hypothetical protein